MPQIGHVLETCLYVDDLSRARKFYLRTFNLPIVYEDARMCAFGAGSTVLLLFRRGQSLNEVNFSGGSIPPHDGSGPLHIALAISAADLPASEQKLRDENIEVEGRVAWPRGGISVYFRDPDGHLVEIATPGLWPNY